MVVTWRNVDRMAPVAVLLFVLQFHTGSMFSMLSRGQMYILNAGDTMDLDCEFYTTYFNLFDNPVLWTKIQFEEHVRMNIMGNINAPFVDSKRFEVQFIPLPPRYRLILSIARVRLEDSGNYTCEVRGPQTVTLTSITHRIFVRAPVDQIAIQTSNTSVAHAHWRGADVSTRYPHEKRLVFRDRIPSPLQCVAVGGNPPPEIKLFLADDEISGRFRVRSQTTMSGTEGLRLMHSLVRKWTGDMTLRARDDGKLLKCSVTVPGLPTEVITSKIHVQYAPRIKCMSQTVEEYDKNVQVTCEIRSSPRVGTLFWITDSNGTTVSEGEVINEYWVIVVDRPDGVIETKLFMRTANPENFRKYTVVAENNVGIQRNDAELKKVQKVPPEAAYGAPSGRNSQHKDGTNRQQYIYINSGTSPVTLAPFILWSLSSLFAFQFTCTLQSILTVVVFR